LAGAAVTTLAKSLPFIASDAAVAFCFFSAIGKEKHNLFYYQTQRQHFANFCCRKLEK
jgi:hypothetical protein